VTVEFSREFFFRLDSAVHVITTAANSRIELELEGVQGLRCKHTNCDTILINCKVFHNKPLLVTNQESIPWQDLLAAFS
jgi:hypothetical protein